MFIPEIEISATPNAENSAEVYYETYPLSLLDTVKVVREKEEIYYPQKVGVVSDMHTFFLEHVGSNFRWPTIDVFLDKFIDEQNLTALIINGDFIDNSIQPNVRKVLEEGNWHHLLSRLNDRLVSPSRPLKKLIFTTGNHDPFKNLLEVKEFIKAMAGKDMVKREFLDNNIVLTEEVKLDNFYPASINTKDKHAISIVHGHKIAEAPYGETLLDKKIDELENEGRSLHAEALRKWKTAWLRRACGLVLNIHAGRHVNKKRPVFKYYSHLLASPDELYKNFAASRDGSIGGGFGHTHRAELELFEGTGQEPDLIMFNSGLWNNSITDSDMFGGVIDQNTIKLQQYEIDRDGNIICQDLKTLGEQESLLDAQAL